MSTLTLPVPDAAAGKRLDQWLAAISRFEPGPHLFAIHRIGQGDMGRHQEAVEAFEQALALAGTPALAPQLARSLIALGRLDEATTLACGYFQSGLRVYDIRDPKKIREIAYYNPGAEDQSKQLSSCAWIPILDAEHGMLYGNCGAGGMVALKFTNKVWPFPESRTPPDRQL